MGRRGRRGEAAKHKSSEMEMTQVPLLWKERDAGSCDLSSSAVVSYSFRLPQERKCHGRGEEIEANDRRIGDKLTYISWDTPKSHHPRSGTE